MIFQVIFGVLAIALLWTIGVYNSLVRLRNRTKEAWADIDVQLKRRYNLIPNLVETVKGYASHEEGVFRKVSEARAKAMGATDPKERGLAENALSQTLKSLFAVSEAYPELKASQNFLELQRELRDTEDKVQAARRFYNANVRDLNITIESFPANMIANSLGFAKMDLFELIAPEEREAPKVKFS
jgi:LemA protein